MSLSIEKGDEIFAGEGVWRDLALYLAESTLHDVDEGARLDWGRCCLVSYEKLATGAMEAILSFVSSMSSNGRLQRGEMQPEVTVYTPLNQHRVFRGGVEFEHSGFGVAVILRANHDCTIRLSSGKTVQALIYHELKEL